MAVYDAAHDRRIPFFELNEPKVPGCRVAKKKEGGIGGNYTNEEDSWIDGGTSNRIIGAE